MNLVIDIGNTSHKAALFEGEKLIDLLRTSNLDSSALAAFVNQSGKQITHCIISSVGAISSNLTEHLHLEPLLFTSAVATPLTIDYETPETLGADRLAAAVAAASFFPETAVLVIDAGSCITWDIVTADGHYLGGGISPGIDMRFHALHTFTEKLPLIDRSVKYNLLGTSTETAIATGVLTDVVGGLSAIIQQLEAQYKNLKIVIGGGDFKYFAEQLNFITFAHPELVITGLNKILIFNENSQ